MANPITEALLTQWSGQYAQSPNCRLATLALARTDLGTVAYNAAGANVMRQKFSVEIPTLEVTDQQASGRCWLFAAANVLRERIAHDLELDSFELSQSHLAFWDKFERANYFLESILQTADLPADDRTVQFVLTVGVHDGGQWDMFANIVRKYGLMPKDVYPDTWQACHTKPMNGVLNRSLKVSAVRLRKMAAAGAAAAELQAEKERTLGKVYAFLCSCYGEPPKTFDFEYVDKHKTYHREPGLTPIAFRDRYVGGLLDGIVSIIHAPTQDKPYGKTYTVRMLGNVVGGRPVKHLNLALEDFKQAIIAQLQAGKVVWFGSDVGKFGERELGIWDDGSFDYALLSGLDLDISKEDALDYSYSAMSHAMVLTGVNLVDGKPTRWKIENSWGDKRGKKGYFVCSDSWFDQYVYQAAVEKEYLGANAALAVQDPVELDPWDPMGTLAD